MGFNDRLPFLSPGRPENRRFFLFAFAAFFLLDCCGPLRLEIDSVHYFSLKDCLDNACPPGFSAANDPHPLGYPFLLWGLGKLGLLHSFVIGLVNTLFLTASLYFVWNSFALPMRSAAFFPLVLLQWTMIKFVAYPLSEMQYLFFSTACIFCMQRYLLTSRHVWMLAAIAALGLAFITRSTGALLAPALLAAWCGQNRVLLRKRPVRIAILVGIVLTTGGLFLLSPYLRVDHYLKSLVDRGSPLPLLGEHLKEWGQLLLNISGNKVNSLLPGAGPGSFGPGAWLLIGCGLAMAGLFFYGFYKLRTVIPVAISVYLILYCLLIFNWPFFDARFWIPTIPYMSMIILSIKDHLVTRSWKIVLWGMLSVYILMGGVAAGYTVYTSFHKAGFARTQAGGIYRNEYETLFFGRPINDTATRIDPYVLDVLKRYN